MKHLFSLFILIGLVGNVFAQIGANSGATHMVEFANFTPPTKELIANFEGFPAIPFIANDQNNMEINLAANKGNTVLLWFIDTDDKRCLNQLPTLNTIAKKYKNKGLKVIAFNHGSREVLNQFLAVNPVDFSMIPHAGVFGEGPYAGELGYPRMFFIFIFGVIKKVLPSEAFNNSFDLSALIEGYLSSYTTLK